MPRKINTEVPTLPAKVVEAELMTSPEAELMTSPEAELLPDNPEISARIKAKALWSSGTVTSLSKLAREVGVCVQTVNTWRVKDNWPTLQEVQEQMTQRMVHKLQLKQVQAATKFQSRALRRATRMGNLLDKAEQSIGMTPDPVRSACSLVKASNDLARTHGWLVGYEKLGIGGAIQPQASPDYDLEVLMS